MTPQEQSMLDGLIGRVRNADLPNKDADADKRIQDMLASDLFKAKTTLFIAHRLESVLKCDRIMVMKEGSIVEFDTPARLLDGRGAFWELYCGESAQ